ncbi:uncharacterized protein LOC110098080 [Dendrobium catenatum]|uniref:uncharacterized protein LOC110098080 n=1 Tax=Dendrobium catenatum TaxID=906689 RepID=UPI0010A06D65|nr:uncharacterized protein LOC110098080 [Dendrobium catenatum]XP_020680452.2 uncharacterized protein LOC110098080 [Dendrobium catenatum]
MLGATLQIARGHGEDRLYSPSKAWRGYHQHLQYLSRSRSSSSAGVWSVPPLVLKEKASVPEFLEPEDRTGSEIEPSNAQSVSASSASSSLCSSLVSENARSSNLDCFLESTTPSIAAQFFYKTTKGGCWTCDIECRPYFTLAELWDSFKEWSAYGASVPLILNGSDCVVQYYVPYLSGIQLYGKYSGRFGEKSYANKSKDFTTDGSGEHNSGKCMKSKGFIQNTSKFSINGFFLRNNDVALTDEFLNNDTRNTDGMLLFEFLEQNAPHSREPLTNKISELSCHFPGLMYLRSCDLLPTSWISVAWYPIYRIPTGTTLKDLDACFLTFHPLSTQIKGILFL